MQTAKLFANGSSQAVRLPRECRFSDNEVFIRKVGEAVLLFPKDRAWETFLEGVDGFTEDYFEAVEGRSNDIPDERLPL